MDRRHFLGAVAGGVAAGVLGSGSVAQAQTKPEIAAPGQAKPEIKGLAFDAFTVFDPGSVTARAEAAFPGKGADLATAWKTRMFEYSWLRCCAGKYADFWHITEDALVYAAKLHKLDLTAQKREQLMHAWLELQAYPDAYGPLKELKSRGLRMAFLANMTPPMLEAAIKNAKLEGYFDILSTDRIKTYKPDPKSYQMAIDAFKLTKEQIAYVAFGPWDAVGAKWFGYRTYWITRLDVPAEECGVTIDGAGKNLADLVRMLGQV